ncbi:unnamed protein product [Polarella glacialis]|uniref:Uncharacterized protein n=1 Tax=Polarella glacialis TaxID=89957 RepID=A0A813K531_POLGL|nr:unnamed protein product [Polarella glacialis]
MTKILLNLLFLFFLKKTKNINKNTNNNNNNNIAQQQQQHCSTTTTLLLTGCFVVCLLSVVRLFVCCLRVQPIQQAINKQSRWIKNSCCPLLFALFSLLFPSCSLVK